MRTLFKMIVAAINPRDLHAFGGLGYLAYGLLAIYALAVPIVVGVTMLWIGVR